jgi:hypothetical protein
MTLEILQWLAINTAFPLLPIILFYLAIWVTKGRITLVTPIRDGQICFYATTIAIIALKDIVAAKPAGLWWLIGLAGCWLVSLFVYSFSVYSTIYPESDEDTRRGIDLRYAVASIACGFLTTVTVIGFRLEYGVLQ